MTTRTIVASLVAVAALAGGAWTLTAGSTDPAGTAVTRVVDGDTFDTPDGRVRVLVMDSCERGTTGGAAATARARQLLDGQRVRLIEQHGAPDRDRYDRLLRYVELPDGRDYAQTMLAEPHTGVYAGRSDASEQRVAWGRAVDRDGRVC